MSKQVKIRLTQGRTGPEGVQPSGSVVSVDEETAKRYIAAQQAELIKETKKSTTDPVKRTTRTSAKQKSSTKRKQKSKSSTDKE